jgi:hypothetical protein
MERSEIQAFLANHHYHFDLRYHLRHHHQYRDNDDEAATVAPAPTTATLVDGEVDHVESWDFGQNSGTCTKMELGFLLVGYWVVVTWYVPDHSVLVSNGAIRSQFVLKCLPGYRSISASLGSGM